MTFVISPLQSNELKAFFDPKAIEVIKYFMIKSLFAQPESMPGQNPIPLHIPKEHIEQWFTQALNVKPVGGGSYPIDVYDPTHGWGADIKMLSSSRNPDGTIKAGDSGEASLGQKFTGIGLALDGMFERKEYFEIMTKWLEIYKEKFDKVSDKYSIDKFFYFFIIRSGESFYLMASHINLDEISQVSVDLNKSNPTSSVWLKNMISHRYGNTKVYKAKKRLELRLYPRNWVEDGLAIEFKTNYLSIESKLRDDLSNESFREKAIEAIKNLEVKVIKD